MIDWKKWEEPKPFGFSGCFRLRNEAQYMERAVTSFLPYLDEACLIVQPSGDDTVEIAERMARENDKVKVFHYDTVIDWIDTPGFYSKDPHKFGHLVHMSNWALSRCSYSWIAKVEGDVIALPTFQNIIDEVTENPDKRVYYGMVILNVAGDNEDQVSLENPRNGGWDEAVFQNHPSYHFERSQKWEVIQRSGSSKCMGWSALHMKRCKIGNVGWNGEHYVPRTPEAVSKALAAYNRAHHYDGPDNPLGEAVLFD